MYEKRAGTLTQGTRASLEGTYDELSAAFQALVNDYVVTKYPTIFAGDFR